MTTFSVDDRIFLKFPEFKCGVIVSRGVNNRGQDVDLIQKLRTVEEENRKEFVLEGLGTVPYFKEWRRAYSSFGVDPTKYKCSSEALARRVIKGDSVPHINKLVDSYNYISLKYHTPCGGEDIDKLSGDIVLKYADGTERFTPLGTREEVTVNKGEIVYASGEEVICAKWNWRESEKTKLTEETTNAFLIIEALQTLTVETVIKSSEELSELISRACGAVPEYHFITFESKSCNLI